MIVTPTHYTTTTKISPQSLVLTVFAKDYTDITAKCKFEFISPPPEGIKISKNVLDISKKAGAFSSKIKASYGKEECFMNFVMSLN